jgi:putative glutamine amidotransferase
MPTPAPPIVGIPVCVRTIDKRVFHTVNEKYLNAVIDAARCLPIVIPALGPRIEPGRIVDMLDGLLLTGSPSNVHPTEYGCAPRHSETLHDPARDATTLPLIREAVRRDLPILAICRGLQELNVALGGTLHQRLQDIPGRLDHRPHRDSPDGPYAPAHAVALTPGGLLAGLAGSAEQVVNSLHSQGIDRPAPELHVEATAPDGQIEAISLPGARFVVGVQWHPEYRPGDHPLSLALFAAFSRACRATRAGFAKAARAA